MRKIYLIPFYLFETIKRKKINISVTIAFGFFVGVINELIVLYSNKEILVFFKDFNTDNLHIFLIYFVSAIFLTIVTILLRILFGWIGIMILEKSRVKIKKITEIICYSYLTCFFGLIPSLGIIVEFVLSAYFLYAGFKILLEKKDWSSIIMAIIITIIMFTPSFFSYVE